MKLSKRRTASGRPYLSHRRRCRRRHCRRRHCRRRHCRRRH